MIVLGIDPGSRRIGYGVVERMPNALRLLDVGTIEPRSTYEPDALVYISNTLLALLIKYNPDAVVLEKLYAVRNHKTVISVAHARGVILSVCASRHIPIQEYTPNEVKSGVTGYGGADKKAVCAMVQRILHEPTLSVVDDASDALALAIMGTQKRVA